MSKQKDKNRLVVGNAQWAKDLPKWLLEEVKTERLMYGLLGITNDEVEKIGDAEVVVYLWTASLYAPMPHNVNQIYFYLSARLMKRRDTKNIPDFLTAKLKEGLNSDQKRELKELRNMIYDKRGGDIDTPLLNIMRQFHKDCQNPQKKLF